MTRKSLTITDAEAQQRLALLDHCVVVLVGTSHPGNIGAAARAMKTMGLSQLRLVAPKEYPHESATSRASGADDVLDAAEVFSELSAAVADCQLVMGASARLRGLEWPFYDPRVAGEQAIANAQQGKVAIVFGREKSGLSNTELAQCQYLIHIPSTAEFGSLNLAAAVQVLAYEVRMAALAGAIPAYERSEIPAPAGEFEAFFTHLQRVITDIGYFDPSNPRHLLTRLRRFFLRAEADHDELNIMRGILAAVEKNQRK